MSETEFQTYIQSHGQTYSLVYCNFYVRAICRCAKLIKPHPMKMCGKEETPALRRRQGSESRPLSLQRRGKLPVAEDA
jgi:hypothetical protein